MLFCNIDENVLLIVIFKAELSVGAVKYYAARRRSSEVGRQLQAAQQRAPEKSVDLVSMNVLDVSTIFRKQP